MNDPILQALSFALDSDLQLEQERRTALVPAGGTDDTGSSRGPLYLRKAATEAASSSSSSQQVILPSFTVLGEDTPTHCLLPGCGTLAEPSIMSRKEDKDKFLAHLLTDHRLVIEDVDKIANLPKYVSYWRERLLGASLSDYCVGFRMEPLPTPVEPARRGVKPKDELKEDTTTEESVVKGAEADQIYYMLTPALPEDDQLRKGLWNKRLETILDINRLEREQQTDFRKQCFFCREVCTRNRSSFFDHLVTSHSFRIGKPDNIVFVEEFLDLVGKKLNELVCPCCERVFKDKMVLREHMRKKGHKMLNPNNSEYNRYYLVNYLEPGKDWKALQEEEQAEDCTILEEQNNEQDWVEISNDDSSTKSSIVCLFCSERHVEFQSVLEHMKGKHRFDFQVTVEKLKMDFYQKVKMVNFIRRSVYLNLCFYCEKKFLERTSLNEHMTTLHLSKDEFPEAKIWDQPEYYFPTYENDQFLNFLDVGNAEDETEDEEEKRLRCDASNVIPEDLPSIRSIAQNEDVDMQDS